MVFIKKKPVESGDDVEIPAPIPEKKDTSRYVLGQIATQVENVIMDTKTNEQVIADVEILNKLDEILKLLK